MSERQEIVNAASESRSHAAPAQSNVAAISTGFSSVGSESCPGCPEVRVYAGNAAVPDGFEVTLSPTAPVRSVQDRIADMHRRLADR